MATAGSALLPAGGILETALAGSAASVPHTPPMRRSRSSSEIALFGIYEISKLLNRPGRLEVTLANIINVLSSFLSMRHGMIVVLDEDDEPEIVATVGWAGEFAGHAIDLIPRGVIDRIVATSTSVVVQDVARDPMFRSVAGHLTENGRARVSFIGVPIKDDGKVVGTLSIDRIWDGLSQFAFDDDLRFLTMVGNLISQTVRLHRIIASDRQKLLDEQRRLEKRLSNDETESRRGREPIRPGGILGGGIVGESAAIRKVMETVQVVGRSNAAVLLRGESGTGKELFARAIHEASPRKAKPFIKLNCAALPESVLESELFGHEKGAFTGAIAQRAGRFEQAHGGTLLLDEIGEISASFQAKLLRVLQEGEFERVGGNRTLKVDVRLVCATNRNLEDDVLKGTFRADLYYRINVVPIFLPPLRERSSDIPLLARAFLSRFSRENNRDMSFDSSCIDMLKRCYFPGNVRELENCVRRTATMSAGQVVRQSDLACHSGQCLSSLLWKGASRTGPKTGGDVISTLASGQPIDARVAEPVHEAAPLSAALPRREPAGSGPREQAVCEHGEADCPALSGARSGERDKLISAMEKSGWVQAKAARILGLTPRQIGYALKKNGIELKRI